MLSKLVELLSEGIIGIFLLVYLSKLKKGIINISLKIGDPNANKIKPNNSLQLKFSLPPITYIFNSFNDNIQIKIVLLVSIVDLATHDAYFVTDTPNVF